MKQKTFNLYYSIPKKRFQRGTNGQVLKNLNSFEVLNWSKWLDLKHATYKITINN